MFLPEEQVAEAPETKATGEESVAPQTATGEAQDTNEATKLASEVTPGVSTEKTEEAQDEVSELLKQERPNVQKRIDKLTAELKTAREELALVRTNKAEPSKAEYTKDQLRAALKQGIENQDEGLIDEVFEYRLNKMKDDLINMYQSEKNQSKEESTRVQTEWNETISAYQRYADPKTPEVYPGSRKDLNIADSDSLIYRVSKALYSDPEKSKYYKSPGGQKLAVADALTIILSKKSGVTDVEKERLKRQLGKEKQKNSPIGAGISGDTENVPSRPMTDSERLAEVIAERTKFKNERVGL